MNLLQVKDLQTHFLTKSGLIPAVNNVSFSIEYGQILGLVGESGSGKSVTALSILGLVGNTGKIVNGSIQYSNREITTLSEKEKQELRGAEIAMIFQDPMTSLNPVFTIGEQIAEGVRLHKKVSNKQALEIAIDTLKLVAVPDPAKRIFDYPHQLSGGMRQRVMIAMALSCEPKLLIADEPTTALDVTIQAQILDLLLELREKKELAILLITHDLGVVAKMADQVAVMYAGKIVEMASVKKLFKSPLHPYTMGLLSSAPRLGTKTKRLQTIEGVVPKLTNLPNGCAFADRCKEVQPQCREKEIDMVYRKEDLLHAVRCCLRT